MLTAAFSYTCKHKATEEETETISGLSHMNAITLNKSRCLFSLVENLVV